MARLTMADLRRAAKRAGSPYFDRGSTRFFGGDQFGGPYKGPGGIFIAQSNNAGHAVKRVSLDPWKIVTVAHVASQLQGRGEAKRLARRVPPRPYDKFTRAFFEAALWSAAAHATEDDRDDRSFQDLGYTLDDIDPYVRDSLAEECESFEEEFGSAIDSVHVARGSGEYSNREQAGHDLWLTRNRHGVGFGDGDWPEPLAELLDDASERLGEVDLYVVGQRSDGRGGTIYASGYEKPR